VKEKQPSNAMVADYLERAQALPDPPAPEAANESDSGGTPAWVWVALAALLMLLVAGGGLLIGRNRRSNTQPAYATGSPVPPTQPQQHAPPRWQPGPQAVATEPPAQQDQVDERSDEPPTVQTPVVPVQREQRLCPNCREPVEEGKRFCGECGAPQ
jgi:hypothetical protein